MTWPMIEYSGLLDVLPMKIRKSFGIDGTMFDVGIGMNSFGNPAWNDLKNRNWKMF